jgi:hypothetical protein
MMRTWAGSRRNHRRATATVAIAMLLASLMAVPASASHYQATLEGSKFQIDDNANLKVDTPNNGVTYDWNNVSYTLKNDKDTGTSDDSYSGGVKEDSTCPSQTTGGIPNNKSDLLGFGVYEEDVPGSAGFMHLFWTRVNEPSGTTLMDFEFNQSEVRCANGPNNVRTVDDILLEYAIDQGGARATITVRRWTGSAWGPARVLSGNDATGTINNTSITQADSGRLNRSLSPRTFGEASINLDAIFNPSKCESFGSAMLKSRASDSFTSQLKDFIEPEPISLTNCGKVIIRKQTDPAGSTQSFGFTKSFATDPVNGNTFTLTGAAPNNVKTFNGVLFGTGLTVTEDVLPADWGFTSVDCNVAGNPSVGVTPVIDGATVRFAIDDANDVLDCTYTNTRRTGSILVHKVDDKGAKLAGAEFTVTPPAAGTKMVEHAVDKGVFCLDGLALGVEYTVTETKVPVGYSGEGPKKFTVSPASTCATRSTTQDLTFSNRPLPGRINILKTNDAGTALAGAGFTLYEDDNKNGVRDAGEITVAAGPSSTGSDGKLSFTDVPLGYYCAVETTTPAGHDTAAPQCRQVTLSTTAGQGVVIELTFVNVREHTVIVIVCHEGTNTLAPSSVANGSSTKTSLSSPPGGLTQAQLCGLQGARFDGLPHGDKDLRVNVGSAAHTP